MRSVLNSLRAALESHALVTFVRNEIENPGQHLIGVPVAVGSRWAILARMDDAIRLDGFDALRLSDLTEVRRNFPRRHFYLRGLALKRLRTPGADRYQADSTRSLLRSAQRSHALVTIDRELSADEGADVGSIVAFGSAACSIRLLSPSGTWRAGRTRLRYRDITRVGFGGEYEETLALVAGLTNPVWR